jgi:release factor glutamine methyltransferase
MERRAAREPLQYILGHWQFRRLELKADGRALVPRPETELTAELAIRAAQAAGREPRVLDIGTGSGCIALSVASEVPGSRVWATDISGDALGLARENAVELNISSVTFLQGDLYAAVPSEMRGSFDVIVSNPPYVTSAEYEELQPEVREHEPAGALLAGDGGMQFQKRLIEKAPEWLRPGGTLVLEGSPAQILALVGAYGAEPVNDLQGLPRCLVLRTT